MWMPTVPGNPGLIAMTKALKLVMLAAVAIPMFCQVDSPSLRVAEKIKEIDNGEKQAILDLGTLGDLSAIPELRRLREANDDGQLAALPFWLRWLWRDWETRKRTK